MINIAGGRWNPDFTFESEDVCQIFGKKVVRLARARKQAPGAVPEFTENLRNWMVHFRREEWVEYVQKLAAIRDDDVLQVAMPEFFNQTMKEDTVTVSKEQFLKAWGVVGEFLSCSVGTEAAEGTGGVKKEKPKEAPEKPKKTEYVAADEEVDIADLKKKAKGIAMKHASEAGPEKAKAVRERIFKELGIANLGEAGDDPKPFQAFIAAIEKEL